MVRTPLFLRGGAVAVAGAGAGAGRGAEVGAGEGEREVCPARCCATYSARLSTPMVRVVWWKLAGGEVLNGREGGWMSGGGGGDKSGRRCDLGVTMDDVRGKTVDRGRGRRVD